MKKTKPTLSYLAEHDPSTGGMLYRVPTKGTGFSTLKDLRKTYPGYELVRIKASRKNRLFC